MVSSVSHAKTQANTSANIQKIRDEKPKPSVKSPYFPQQPADETSQGLSNAENHLRKAKRLSLN